MTSAPSRNDRVDIIRGVAVSCVLVLHFTLAFGLKNSPLGTILPEWLLRGLTLNGNYGVTMFFVVSGFLITSLSLRRWGRPGNLDARAFYVFRFARIMPPLLLALAVIVPLGCLGIPFFSNSDNGKSLPPSYFVVAAGSVLTFWHNVLMQKAGYFNYCLNIYWSLSVEEVFYLAMPLLCLILRRIWPLVLICCAAIVIGPFYRRAHVENEIFFMYGYWACFDAIAMGCLTALLAQKFAFGDRTARIVRFGCGIALAVLYVRGIDGHEVFGFTFIALAVAGYLLASAQAPAPGPVGEKLTRPIRWLGRHSYEIYLFHIIVLAGMRNFATKATLSYGWRLPWFVLFLFLTAIVAWAVARYVSEPMNAAIRKRFAKTSV
jgi:peptidoglycan/LPS O-acetylase OafA/YrhL